MINNETVSVIMAVYNCEDTVGEAIESILNQTYNDIQFIICNDCSTDKTADIVKKYAEEKPDTIIYIENEKNMKLPYSLNHCLKYATGKYIARMDGDDISYPDRIETQVNYLKEHSDIDLVGTGMDMFNGEEIFGQVFAKEHPEKEDSICSTPFCHATILTYSYVYEKLKGYTIDDSVIRVEDVDLWVRFFAAGFKGENIQKAYYRVLEDENTMSRRRIINRINSYRITKKGAKTLGVPKRLLFNRFISIAKGLIPKRMYILIHRARHKTN